MSDSLFSRPLNLCRQVVILDGLTGTGKTMFGPLLASFDRMQNPRFEYMIEYLSIAGEFGKINTDASASLLNLLADIKYYDGSISREVNFRPGDLSSVFKSSNSVKYLRQLFMKDGEAAGKRLETERPILFFVTHQILSCAETLFNAFADRLKIVQMVRHPLYLLDHWDSYIMMHGNNARDFAVWLDYNGNMIPWFAKGWEQKYIASSSFDRSVYSIESLMEVVFSYMGSDDKEKNMIFIPFEKFVLDPVPFIAKLEEFLGTTTTPYTRNILKKQHVPRPSINAGPQKSIYKRYALKRYEKGVSHEEDYQQRLESAKQKSSPEAFAIVQKMSKRYEDAFGTWF